jgi:hypothetical protein
MRPSDGGQSASVPPGPSDSGQQGGGASVFASQQFDCPRDFRRPPRYALHLRVYDVSTSQIVSAVRVSADNQWCLVKAAVQRMVTQMEKFPWKTRVASVTADRIVLDGGKDVNMSYDFRFAHQAGADRTLQAAGPDPEPTLLTVSYVGDVATVARPSRPGAAPDIKTGDWVVFEPDGQGKR